MNDWIRKKTCEYAPIILYESLDQKEDLRICSFLVYNFEQSHSTYHLPPILLCGATISAYICKENTIYGRAQVFYIYNE